MTGFALGATALVVLSLAFLLWPLRRRPASADFSRQALNAAIYRDELAELKRDLAEGALIQADYDQAYAELQRRLLEDSAPDETVVAPPASGRTLTAILALGLPLAAIVLYLTLGNPAALKPQPVPQQFTADDIDRMVSGLAAKLEQEPNNLQGWAMLARSYKSMGRYPDAIKAYERAGSLVDGNPDLLVDYADTLAAGVGFNDKSLSLIDRALKLDPQNLQGRWLRGTAHFNAKRFDAAIADWEALRKLLPEGSQEAGMVSANIEEARALQVQAKPVKPGPARKDR